MHIPGMHHLQARGVTITTHAGPRDATLDGEVRGSDPHVCTCCSRAATGHGPRVISKPPAWRPQGPTRPDLSSLATTIRRWGREAVYSSGEGGVMGMGGPLRSPCWITNRSPRNTRKSLGEKHLGKACCPGVKKSYAQPETMTPFFVGDRYDMLGFRSMLPALLTAHRQTVCLLFWRVYASAPPEAMSSSSIPANA